jgi:uncharacterized protein YkwD
MQLPSAKIAGLFLLVSLIFGLPKPIYAASFNFNFPSWFPSFNFIMPQMVVTPTPVVPTTWPIATPTPTVIPTATPKPMVIPTTRPSSTPAPVTSSVKDYIMKGINDYRASQGLVSIQTDSNTCNFAKIRAQEISINFNHDGFTNRVNSHSLPYPSYHSVTENIALNPDYKQVVPVWINSPGHAANMRADTPYVCVEQYGNFYAYEGWKP